MQTDHGAVKDGHSNRRPERKGMGELSPLTLAVTFLLLAGGIGERVISSVSLHILPTLDRQGNYHPSLCHSPGLRGLSSLSGHRTPCSSQESRWQSIRTVSAPLLIPSWSKSIIRHIPQPCCTPDIIWQRDASLCCTTC